MKPSQPGPSESVNSRDELRAELEEVRRELEALRAAVEERQTGEARTRSTFLSNIGHEIRTPLNEVLGMTSLLLAMDLTPEQQEYVGAIQSSSEGLLKTLGDILEYSQIEAGELEMHSSAFDPRSLVGEAIDLLELAVAEKGLKLSCRIEPEVPTHLVGDPARLAQVLHELLSNAVKFTRAGRVTLVVALDRDDETTALLRFVVSDSGIGISEEQRATLFDPFTQGDASATRSYGGTGLGLAIARSLAEKMGGEIAVASVPDRGSRFTFSVPLSKAVT